jgi:hypothetical protein
MAIIRDVRERIGMKYTVQTREHLTKITRGEKSTTRTFSLEALNSLRASSVFNRDIAVVGVVAGAEGCKDYAAEG